MIESATDAERALAHSGVLKPGSKLATHKAAHSAVHALGAEPSSLSSRAGIDRLRDAEARWVKGPQARALADQQLCQGSKHKNQFTSQWYTSGRAMLLALHSGKAMSKS